MNSISQKKNYKMLSTPKTDTEKISNGWSLSCRDLLLLNLMSIQWQSWNYLLLWRMWCFSLWESIPMGVWYCSITSTVNMFLSLWTLYLIKAMKSTNCHFLWISHNQIYSFVSVFFPWPRSCLNLPSKRILCRIH